MMFYRAFILLFLFLLVGCTTHKQFSKSSHIDTLYIEKIDTVKLVSFDTISVVKDNFVSIVDSTVIREYIDELGVKNREIERYRDRLNSMSSDKVETHDMTASEKSSSVVESSVVDVDENVVVEPEQKPSFFLSLFQKIGNAIFFIIWTFFVVVIIIFVYKVIIINKKKDLWKY